MAFISFIVENNDIARDYIGELIQKSQERDFLKNPYKSHIKFILGRRFEGQRGTTPDKGSILLIYNLEPLYPRVYYWSIPFFALLYLFPSFWLAVAACALLSPIVLWWGELYLLLSYIGLKRRGYKGIFQRLSASSAWVSYLGSSPYI